jgi:DNA-binding LytR/AlgR family response regulator
MKTIRVLLVEDEPIIAADLADRLADMGYEVAQQCSSGEEAIAFFQQQEVDLVLMDIKLDGLLDGVDTAGMMLKQRALPIIYLTSNSDDATFSRAKNTFPAAFLTKPFRGKDLQHAIELAITRVQPANTKPEISSENREAHLFKDRLFLKVKDRMIRLFLSDILWVEADDYYCKLVTKDKEYLITQPLKQMEEALSTMPAFMRVHRSFMVNLSHIEEIGDMFVSIHKKQIPLNKSSREELVLRLQKI